MYLDDGRSKTGVSHSKSGAVLDAESAINKALSAAKAK